MIDSKLFCVREKNVGVASFPSTKVRRAVKSADQQLSTAMLGERVVAFIRANGLYEWGESDLDRMPPLPSASPRPPLTQAHTQALAQVPMSLSMEACTHTICSSMASPSKPSSRRWLRRP